MQSKLLKSYTSQSSPVLIRTKLAKLVITALIPTELNESFTIAFWYLTIYNLKKLPV